MRALNLSELNIKTRWIRPLSKISESSQRAPYSLKISEASRTQHHIVFRAAQTFPDPHPNSISQAMAMPVTKMLNQPLDGDRNPPGGQPPRSPEGTERRPFRPPYSEEEVDFIWYHRIDLGYEWADVERAYQHQFPNSGREGFTGIQCKYYRFCDEKGIPKVRDRSKENSQVELYGMRARSGRTYPWMRR